MSVPVLDRPLPRRTLLRGLGAAIALPALEAMRPRRARAQGAPRPLRLGIVHIPNGWPFDGGHRDRGPYLRGLELLAPVRDDVTLIHGFGSGARAAHAKRKDQPAGDAHGQGAVTVMSAQVPTALGSKGWGIPMTADQVIASERFGRWRFPSLGVNVQPVGIIDHFHQPIYTRTLFWKGPGAPVKLYSDPQELFDLMFGGAEPALSPAQQEARRREKRSLIDFAKGDVLALRGRLGAADARRLDQYLTSLRDVERHLGVPPTPGRDCRAVESPPDLAVSIATYPERYRLLQKLMAKAFECDLTRVFQFMVGHEVMRPGYVPGVDGGRTWHTYSHDDYEVTRRIVAWHIERFRELVLELKAVREPDGPSLLDDSLLVFFSGCGDSSSHEFHNGQAFLAGRGGGRYRTGLVENVGGDVGDLWLTVMNDFGLGRASFGHGKRILAPIRA